MILKSTYHKASVKGFNSLEDAIKYNEPLVINLPLFEHSLPDFPKWSARNKKMFGHTINLFLLTCTCDYYIEQAVKLGDRDFRKVCIHLYYGLRRYSDKLFDDFTKMLLENHYRYRDDAYYKFDDKNIIVTQRNKEWIKIISLVEGHWRIYRYNLTEGRFAYNSNFPHHLMLPQIIHAIKK